MIKFRYTYTNFPNFPNASEASQRFGSLTILFGIALLFSLFGFAINVIVGIISLVSTILISLFILKNFHDRPVLKAMFGHLKEVSDEQKEELVTHFMNGKRIGKGDLTGAYSLASALLHAETGIRNGDYTKKEYYKVRHQILNRYSIKDIDYDENFIENIPEYSFENVSEYRLYTKLCGKAYWKKNDMTYSNLLHKGLESEEKKDYVTAIGYYVKAFDINPIALKARFQLVNALIQNDEYEDAENELLTLGDYLEEIDDLPDTTIAKFYRLYGFILVEKGELELAYSIYKYSLLFQEKDTVYDELTYIKNKAPDTDFYAIDYRQTVNNSQIKVFKPKERIN